jgi:hypothetical protein
MKREYERLELELTVFDSASDVVRTSIGTGRFDDDWATPFGLPWNEGDSKISKFRGVAV